MRLKEKPQDKTRLRQKFNPEQTVIRLHLQEARSRQVLRMPRSISFFRASFLREFDVWSVSSEMGGVKKFMSHACRIFAFRLYPFSPNGCNFSNQIISSNVSSSLRLKFGSSRTCTTSRISKTKDSAP